jgi:hypothetical protein
MADESKSLVSNEEAVEKLMRNHISQLMEHFDSVSIVATKWNSENNDTYATCYGSGDYHARFGAMFNWIEGQKELMRKSHVVSEDEDRD